MLAKPKLNTIKFLKSEAVIDSYINHDEFVLVNNVLREYNDMKKKKEKSWKYCRIYYVKTIRIKLYKNNIFP